MSEPCAAAATLNTVFVPSPAIATATPPVESSELVVWFSCTGVAASRGSRPDGHRSVLAASCCAAALAVPPGEAFAAAAAVLSWVTRPSSPGEKTRTETVVFATPSCAAMDAASAPASAGRSESVVAVVRAVATFACEDALVVARASDPDDDGRVGHVALGRRRIGARALHDGGVSRHVDGGRDRRARIGRCPILLPDVLAVPGLVDRTMAAVLSTSF